MRILLKNSKIILSLIIFLISCEEPNKSDSIWDENDIGSSTPVISTVIPSQNAFAGIDTILISGSNFSIVSDCGSDLFSESFLNLFEDISIL